MRDAPPPPSPSPAALSGYSEGGGGGNLEVRAVDDGECVPLLRHKSKAKVGSEVQAWARGGVGVGQVLLSEELFDDAEGVQ